MDMGAGMDMEMGVDMAYLKGSHEDDVAKRREATLGVDAPNDRSCGRGTASEVDSGW